MHYSETKTPCRRHIYVGECLRVHHYNRFLSTADMASTSLFVQIILYNLSFHLLLLIILFGTRKSSKWYCSTFHQRIKNTWSINWFQNTLWCTNSLTRNFYITYIVFFAVVVLRNVKNVLSYTLKWFCTNALSNIEYNFIFQFIHTHNLHNNGIGTSRTAGRPYECRKVKIWKYLKWKSFIGFDPISFEFPMG